MAQFDVFQFRSSGAYPLVVDVQAAIHARLSTRVVVPMALRTRYLQPTTRLNPIMRIGDDDYVVLTPLMAAVPTASLGKLVGSVAAHRSTLIAALDLLITGS